MSNSNTPENLPQAVNRAIDGLPLPWWAKTAKALSRIIGTVVSPERMRQVSAEIDRAHGASELNRAMVGAVAEKWSKDPAMVARFEQRYYEQEFGRQERLESICEKSAEELRLLVDHSNADVGQGEPEAPPEEDIDEDWQRKFTTFAQDVSEPQMQRVWARILAGEIRKPGSFSYRTLRLVSEMDPAVAVMFQEAAEDCLNREILFVDSIDRWNSGHLYLRSVAMRDWGITSEVAGTSRRPIPRDDHGRYFVFGAEYGALIYSPEGATNLELQIIQLTNSGKELLALLPVSDEKALLRRVVGHLKQRVPHGPGCFAFVGRRFGFALQPDEFLWGSAADLNNMPSAP